MEYKLETSISITGERLIYITIDGKVYSTTRELQRKLNEIGIDFKPREYEVVANMNTRKLKQHNAAIEYFHKILSNPSKKNVSSKNKHIIKAKSDASYKEYDNQCYIGIGISVEQRGGINFNRNEKYMLLNKMNAQYAELMSTIILLKSLQKIHNQQITVSNDNSSIIQCINRILSYKLNSKKMMHTKIFTKYELECVFLQFLITNIKNNGNSIIFDWQPRENNKICDRLSKKMDDFEIDYILSNGDNGIYRCKATNEIEAQKQCKKHISNSENYILKREIENKLEEQIKRINEKDIVIEIPKRQSKTMLNKMIKIFKRTGKAYA